MLPRDPMILISFINTKLRDNDCSLTELCEDQDEDPQTLLQRLHALGVYYDAGQNQLRHE